MSDREAAISARGSGGHSNGLPGFAPQPAIASSADSRWHLRVRVRTSALEGARLETLRKLAIAAEYRDDETYEHTERVGRTAALIARQLALPEETVALIRRAAPLHDIGKVGVPDAVLLKPGKLSPEEARLMQEHVIIGARNLARGTLPVPRMARQIVLSHHERWDGNGYPGRRSGGAISLTGRIVAVADVFDALTHKRPYKLAWIEDYDLDLPVAWLGGWGEARPTGRKTEHRVRAPAR